MELDFEDLGSKALPFTSPQILDSCLTSLTLSFLSGQLGNLFHRADGQLK